jgi:hypothetical protein
MRPTVAGRPASVNSSFVTGSVRGGLVRGGGDAQVLTPRERALVAACVRPAAEALGDSVPETGVWRARSAGSTDRGSRTRRRPDPPGERTRPESGPPGAAPPYGSAIAV